ncbi:MAG: xanthine dehydrogenase accessory protein XdhC [Rhodobacter sp.]|nr:xanthine dehydrogenase accessory protein XdhC [Rhodobacter sp.]
MIDLPQLTGQLEAYGRVARIVIAGHNGSTPRETGAAMCVWDGGQSGTIGGGRLEFEAVKRAREMLDHGPGTEVRRQALGPALAQCCGGSVTLVTEVWNVDCYRAEIDTKPFEFQGVFVRRVEGDRPLPDKARRRLQASGDDPIPTQLIDGWLIEQVWRDRQPVFIYGAGHVGNALARVLAPLPQFEVHVADVRPPMLEDLPGTVLRSSDILPIEVMAKAPPEAAHFIMTPEHEYDLALCHQVLQRPFAYAGLIGSATKWARFRKRLAAMGHTQAEIGQIECPIGDPALGKRPYEIAIGVAAGLLARRRARPAIREDVA